MSLNIYGVVKHSSTLEKCGASTLDYLSNISVCCQPLNILARLVTPFVIFLRKIYFVVILTAHVLVVKTVVESCNTMTVTLQSSHLLRGLCLAKSLLTVTLTELLAYSVTLARSVVP